MRKVFIYISLLILFVAPVKTLGQEGSTDYQYALIEAVKQKNLGNIPGAIELYNMVIEANDSVAIAYFELGSLYILVKETAKSEENFRKAYELDPGNDYYLNGLIDILAIREKYEEADVLLDDIISSREDDIEFCFKRANIFFLAGNGRKAIKSLNKIEKKYGVSDKITLLKANIYEEAEKFKLARKEIEKLIAYFPESLQFLVVAAELAHKEKESALASKYYTQVLDLDSTNIYALTNLTDYYRERKEYSKSFYYLEKSFSSDYIEYKRKMSILSYYLTDKYFMQNYSSQLEGLIRTVLNKYPKERDAKLYAVDFYIQQGQYREAYDILKPILTDKDRDYELWKKGVLLVNALSDHDELLSIVYKTYEIFPDSAEIIYFKGIAEFENKLYEKVVDTFEDDILSKHNNKELVFQTKQILAESYHHLNIHEKSDSLYRFIITVEPDNYMVLNNFSYYLSLRGEFLEEARTHSYRTIVANPENGTFLDTYAWILYKSGEYKEAELYINKALQKGGLNDPDVNEHAADIHMKLESYHIARSFYEKAIILGGDKEKLEKKLMLINEK